MTAVQSDLREAAHALLDAMAEFDFHLDESGQSDAIDNSAWGRIQACAEQFA